MKSPRPRKYPFTLRRLAANRANLARANAVPECIRDRPTRRRRAAALANLAKAHAAREAGRGRLRHGLYCRFLAASLRRAGDSLADFRTHTGLFERAFGVAKAARPEPGGRKSATSELAAAEDRKLVRALAETAWRRLRAFRLLGQVEARHLTQALTRSRPPYAGPPTTAETRRLALELVGIFSEHVPLIQHTYRFDKRIERLLRVLLERRGLPGFRWSSQRRQNDSRLLEAPSDLANNPLTAPGQLADWQAPRRSLAPHARALAKLIARLRRFPGTASQARLPSLRRCLRLFEDAFGRPAATSTPASSPPRADSELVGELAKTAWARLRVFPQRARWEAATLDRILRRAALSQPLTPEETRELAWRLVRLFAGDLLAFETAAQLDRQLVGQLQELLTERGGASPAAQLFGPSPELDELEKLAREHREHVKEYLFWSQPKS
jgi:hypothetical protein